MLIDINTTKLNPVDIIANLRDYVLENLPKYFNIDKDEPKSIKYD